MCDKSISIIGKIWYPFKWLLSQLKTYLNLLKVVREVFIKKKANALMHYYTLGGRQILC